MASTRFTVLTGHLSQYSLADLIGILRHQRKTGRLLIEYIGSPAILFFKDGNLVDAQYNTLVGVQAIFVAFVQPPAAFNFNPLFQPTRDSIDFEQRRVILELLGCWTEDEVVVKSVTPRDGLSTRVIQQPELQSVEPQLVLPPAPIPDIAALPEAETMLALPAGPPTWLPSFRSIRKPWVLALATFVLVLAFGLPTLIAINNKARKVVSTPAASKLESKSTEPISPASSVANTEQLSAKAGPDDTGSALEIKREHDQVDRQRTEREQAPNNTNPDVTVKDPVLAPAPPKDAAQSNASAAGSAQPPKPKQAATTSQTVKVVMRIENGRVIQATVGDRRAGAEAYEALALRIARQRRYPAGVNKQETLLMKVDGPK